MYLVLSIVLSTILGFVLLFFGTYIAGVIAFGIIVGCLFRGLYLLNDIHKSLDSSPKKNKVQVAYESYLNEREKGIH
ncbi:hypothetical protein KD050_18325 [Psychrobacillus sp. INOP01]|uniref:hypothetical protein n=1 Tax=Psychrobacillus sp. INOP01 TaxID=2829187 RepID=UPI001BA6F81C|nr:hypothetical protein [Psychrobacillus sp. INOP01]QUG41215.1 hypothetical protein KD050_18325 [Psychrobacillus sp. INOP01]